MGKIQCLSQLSGVIVAATVCLVGCFCPVSTPLETSSPDTSTPSSTQELPTYTPTLTTISITATPDPTRAPVPTCPIPPTLTSDQERSYPRDMLATNGGCELPCWWGSTPGQSDWQCMKQQFDAYDAYYFDVKGPNGYSIYYILNEFTEQDGIVQYVQVRSEFTGYVQEDKDEDEAYAQFTQDWKHYSLDQVLTRYGVPSRVRIRLGYDGGGNLWYQLYIFYDDLGIGIRYIGPAEAKGELLRACFLLDRITLWLQSPESSEPLDRHITADEWSVSDDIEKAIDMTVEEFYETFRHPGACLEVSKEVP